MKETDKTSWHCLFLSVSCQSDVDDEARFVMRVFRSRRCSVGHQHRSI